MLLYNGSTPLVCGQTYAAGRVGTETVREADDAMKFDVRVPNRQDRSRGPCVVPSALARFVGRPEQVNLQQAGSSSASTGRQSGVHEATHALICTNSGGREPGSLDRWAVAVSSRWSAQLSPAAASPTSTFACGRNRPDGDWCYAVGVLERSQPAWARCWPEMSAWIRLTCGDRGSH